MTVTQSHWRRLNIGIIGGGIGTVFLPSRKYTASTKQRPMIVGGLAAATSLRRAGHSVTVYERSEYTRNAGASISCPANGSKWLAKWGVDISHGQPVSIHKQIRRDIETGEVLDHLDLSDYADRWGHDYYNFYRVDMHRMLWIAATSQGDGEPAVVKMGHTCDFVNVETGQITFSNGITIQHDLVVGADGIGSRIRRCLGFVPERKRATSGCIHCVIKTSEVHRLGLPEMARSDSLEYWGQGLHKIVYSACRGGSVQSLYLFFPLSCADHEEDQENWTEEATYQQALKPYPNLDQRLRTLIAHSFDIRPWRLFEHSPYAMWQLGRTCIMGDAAHPMLPDQSQGACQAIKDAGALGVVFSRDYTFTNDITAGLQLYECVRKPRASRVQAASARARENLSERIGFSTSTDSALYRVENEAQKLTIEEINRLEEVAGVVFNDPELGVAAGYEQLIDDIVHTQNAIYETLDGSNFDGRGLLQEDNLMVGLLAPNGYACVVGSLAILSLGGAVVPLAPALLPEEGTYFLRECRSCLLLSAPELQETARAMMQHTDHKGSERIRMVPIATMTGLTREMAFKIDSHLTIARSRPGLVIFTSGTIGPPKGVVLPRAVFDMLAPKTYEHNGVFLSHRVVHWIGGITPLIALAVCGTRIDFLKPSSPPAAFWERIRWKRVTIFFPVPSLMQEMKVYFEQHIRGLPPARRKDYIEGARHIQFMQSSSAMPAPSTLAFWTELRGKAVKVAYASTEAGGVASRTSGHPTLDSSIGKPLPDVEFKLSSDGEILLKSPRMILRYLNNEKAMRAAVDADGFYHTGDLAHKVGSEYIFDGRASTDIIRIDTGYKVLVPPVEHALLSLSYISEASVVPLPDPSVGYRVAAVIRVCEGEEALGKVTLQRIRDDLFATLPAYTIPTALRILSNNELLPRSDSGKLIKRVISDTFFNGPHTEFWDLNEEADTKAHKPWDWAGIQR
ncbi:hypothetical protein CNMCM6457_003640 [Aspergillus fumigatiaffinis]|nr:hypothetical protein CNMCM6457_003640 [Aspergillus fumigatiaffinis]